MSGSNFDCYLCGSTNTADADFCANCSGRLLKIPDAPVEDEVGAAMDLDGLDGTIPDEDMFDDNSFEEVADEEPETPAGKSRRRRSIHTSVEDQRLSDALGLTEEEDELDRIDTQVTSIPTARAAENIPVLGTGGTSFLAKDDDEVGPVAYVIVAMLIVATVWFGYDSLIRGRQAPESIAFTGTTTTIAPATTSTIPDNQPWSLDRVDSHYGSTIVRLIAHDCDGGTDPSEPLIGIALDEQSVILAPNAPAGTDAVRIVTRTGSSRSARVNVQNGVRIATAVARTSRNLEIVEAANESMFFVGYDFESNVVSTTETPQGLDAEISVSEFGNVHQVRIGESIISGSTLAAINVTADVNPEAEGGESVCAQSSQVALTAPATGPGEGTEDVDPDAGEAAGTGAGE